MQKKYPKLTEEDISRTTFFNKKYLDELIETVKEYTDGVNKDIRLAESKCEMCFYFRRSTIAGAAMTESNCRLCDTMMMFSSTNTDHLCDICAKTHKLCKHCGGNVNIKGKSKK